MLNENNEVKINNLAIAEFRKFCKNNGLDFYFPGDNPSEKFNPKLSSKEWKLLGEAEILFNKTNPRIYTSDGVVEFFFSGHSLNYNICSAETLIKERDNLIAELGEWKKRYSIFAIVGATSFLIVLIWLFNRLWFYIDPLDLHPGWQTTLLYVLIICVVLCESFVKRAIKSLENRNNRKKNLELQKSIIELRHRLEAVKNDQTKD